MKERSCWGVADMAERLRRSERMRRVRRGARRPVARRAAAHVTLYTTIPHSTL